MGKNFGAPINSEALTDNTTWLGGFLNKAGRLRLILYTMRIRKSCCAPIFPSGYARLFYIFRFLEKPFCGCRCDEPENNTNILGWPNWANSNFTIFGHTFILATQRGGGGNFIPS
jgi:hypothetical protein